MIFAECLVSASATEQRSPESVTLNTCVLNHAQLFETYLIEGFPMPYTIEDFRRKFTLDQGSWPYSCQLF